MSDPTIESLFAVAQAFATKNGEPNDCFVQLERVRVANQSTHAMEPAFRVTVHADGRQIASRAHPDMREAMRLVHQQMTDIIGNRESAAKQTHAVELEHIARVREALSR